MLLFYSYFVFKRMSALDAPTKISKSPGSTLRFVSAPCDGEVVGVSMKET